MELYDEEDDDDLRASRGVITGLGWGCGCLVLLGIVCGGVYLLLRGIFGG